MGRIRVIVDTIPAKRSKALPELLHLALLVGAALLVGFLVTLLASNEPVRAYKALLTGVIPDVRRSADGGWTVYRMTRFGAVLQDAMTLTLLGLAVTIAFRARQFSLGADGQLFLGALGAAIVSLTVPGPSFLILPLACLAAICTGFAWGLAPGILKARFGANEIVTTLMFNIVALQIYRLVIIEFMNDPAAGFVTTPLLPNAALLHSLIPRTNVTAMIFIVALAVALGWFLLMRTTIGFEIRVIGESPFFAHQVGMPVGRAIALSMAIGGGFAGLAGFHISNALLKRLPVDLNPGIGLEGIVVALLARNNPTMIPVAAFLYAYLRVGAQVMERTTDVSREMVMIIQAFIILFVVSDRLRPVMLRAWRRLRRSVSSVMAGGRA
jgi:simple sugar transport system permease protein